MYVVIWRYQVRQDKLADFEQLYGPEGEWVRWFDQSGDYLSTELLKSTASENEYVTIDRWTTKATYERFYETGKERFKEIDLLGDSLTIKEELIGSYEGD